MAPGREVEDAERAHGSRLPGERERLGAPARCAPAQVGGGVRGRAGDRGARGARGRHRAPLGAGRPARGPRTGRARLPPLRRLPAGASTLGLGTRPRCLRPARRSRARQLFRTKCTGLAACRRHGAPPDRPAPWAPAVLQPPVLGGLQTERDAHLVAVRRTAGSRAGGLRAAEMREAGCQAAETRPAGCQAAGTRLLRGGLPATSRPHLNENDRPFSSYIMRASVWGKRRLPGHRGRTRMTSDTAKKTAETTPTTTMCTGCCASVPRNAAAIHSCGTAARIVSTPRNTPTQQGAKPSHRSGWRRRGSCSIAVGRKAVAERGYVRGERQQPRPEDDVYRGVV